MNISIFVFLLFGLQIFYWLVSRRAVKSLKNKEDYFLAGKNVRLFPLMMTFLATQVGGGAVLGAAEEAYHFGLSVLLYPLGIALGLIVLGAGIGRKLAGFPVTTVAQLFDVVYRSAMLKKVASFLSVISLFMILVAQIIASNKFLVSLGCNNNYLFIALWASVILYTARGGLRAVISTDMVQAAFFSVVFFLCFGLVLFTNTSSFSFPQIAHFAPVSSKLCGWLLMPLLFMVIEQDMGQRCFAGASPRIVSRATLLAGLSTMAVCSIPVFFGYLARGLGLEVQEGASVLMTFIAKITNPWISALVGCAVLAAIISTATSLINAISSNLSSDFNFSFFRGTSALRIVKMMTCAISIASIFFAFHFNNIVDLLIQSYELSVSCLFVPLFIGLFKKRGNFVSALLSMLAGGVGFILFRFFPIAFPKEIVSILFSLFGFCCGEIFAHYIERKRGIVY